MATIPEKTIFINYDFRDFETFARTAKEWDADFLQLDGGEFRAQLTQLMSGNHLFTFSKLNRKLYQRGSPPKNLWTFAILENSSSSLIWRGHELSPYDIMIYSPGSEIDCVSQPGFTVLTYSTSEDYIYEILETVGVFGLSNLKKLSSHITCSVSEIKKLRFHLSQYAKALSSSKEKTEHDQLSPLMSELEYNIPKKFLETIAAGRIRSDIPPLRLRNYALKQAMECIEMSATDNLTVKGLCHVTGVSDRTLEYAFREKFGITPKAYIRAYRLNRVNRILTRSDRLNTKVCDVANRWGFWHMGQFANDYKKLFGELPSETAGRRTKQRM